MKGLREVPRIQAPRLGQFRQDAPGQRYTRRRAAPQIAMSPAWEMCDGRRVPGELNLTLRPKAEPDRTAAGEFPGREMADFALVDSRNVGEAALSPEDEAFLKDCFLYHSPGTLQRDQLFEVNASAREFAITILRQVPPSPDRSAALRALREAKMWANSAVVLEGRR